MKLSNKQKKDLESIMYFIPWTSRHIKITDEDIKKFFEYSDQGKHKKDVNAYKGDGFNTLIQGKRWRGIHAHEMYEEGILDGTMPYYVILGGYKGENVMPRVVVDFMKGEMFKGIDAELIEKVYQYILWEKTPWYKKIWKTLWKIKKNSMNCMPSNG